MTTALQQAVQAVLDRWNSPKWNWHKQGPTADLMHALQSAIAQPARPAAAPCQNESMGKHACKNRNQCWELCGELGHSAEHARPSERNFCGRCGKRLGSILSIHTCSPPDHIAEVGKMVQPAEPLTDELMDEVVRAYVAAGKRGLDLTQALKCAFEAAHSIKPKEA